MKNIIKIIGGLLLILLGFIDLLVSIKEVVNQITLVYSMHLGISFFLIICGTIIVIKALTDPLTKDN
jgi:hypothetical protein